MSVVHYTACLVCRREEAIRAIEEEIRRERWATEEVIQAMPAAEQEKYFSMTSVNEELLQVRCLGLTLMAIRIKHDFIQFFDSLLP